MCRFSWSTFKKEAEGNQSLVTPCMVQVWLMMMIPPFLVSTQFQPLFQKEGSIPCSLKEQGQIFFTFFSYLQVPMLSLIRPWSRLIRMEEGNMVRAQSFGGWSRGLLLEHFKDSTVRFDILHSGNQGKFATKKVLSNCTLLWSMTTATLP